MDKQEWISVKDKLPEYVAHAGSDNFVHVIASFSGCVQQAMYCNGKWDAFGLHGIKPTHWMSLPEPPTDKLDK